MFKCEIEMLLPFYAGFKEVEVGFGFEYEISFIKF